MTKLHEILAVEGDLEATAKKVVKEATGTFTNKTEHFRGAIKTLKMFDENRQQEETIETLELTTTVADKLAYVAGSLAKHYNVMAEKDMTNMSATANLEIDGKVLLTNAPATLLLGLENKLKQLRQMYECIPTLAPGTKWGLDNDLGKNVYRSVTANSRHKTEKQIMSKIVAEATNQHKAQVETWSADVPIGEWQVEQFSGAITPGEKSSLLQRLDILIQEAKRARQRANCAEVTKVSTFGKDIFKYIHNV